MENWMMYLLLAVVVVALLCNTESEENFCAGYNGCHKQSHCNCPCDHTCPFRNDCPYCKNCVYRQVPRRNCKSCRYVW